MLTSQKRHTLICYPSLAPHGTSSEDVCMAYLFIRRCGALCWPKAWITVFYLKSNYKSVRKGLVPGAEAFYSIKRQAQIKLLLDSKTRTDRAFDSIDLVTSGAKCENTVWRLCLFRLMGMSVTRKYQQGTEDLTVKASSNLSISFGKCSNPRLQVTDWFDEAAIGTAGTGNVNHPHCL